MKIEIAAKKLLTPGIHSAFGFRFLMDNASTLMLNEDCMTDVFHGLCQIHYQEEEELLAEPTEDDENHEAILADVTAKNEDIKKRNERLNKIKTRVRIFVEKETDYTESEEKGLIKLLNYRDPPMTAEAVAEPAP